MKSMTIGIDQPPGRLAKRIRSVPGVELKWWREEMTKEDVGNTGQPRLAARGSLGVSLSRGIQRQVGRKVSKAHLLTLCAKGVSLSTI
jgi:hypothetical protein